MTAFGRMLNRFIAGGLDLNSAPDSVPPNKYPFQQNVRSYIEGTIQAREGLTLLNAVGSPFHSIFRLNDPTPFNGGIAAYHIAGAGVSLFALPAGGVGAFPQIDTGYSGNPLMVHYATPPKSPQPWAYVVDSARMRKIRVDGTVYQIGTPQPSAPTTAPTVALAQIGLNTISDFNNAAGWTAAGAVAGAPTNVTRVNTTISQILYDSGATGYASVVPAAFTNINEGVLLTVGGAETALVTRFTIAVATTTIAGIIYDVGNTGLCTIQPTASLGTGELDAPPIAAYRDRVGYAVPRGQAGRLANGQFQPIPPEPTPLSVPTARIRQVDFPVDCLVTLAGAETVRILSVAVGQDGRQSFRCVTTGTRGAGDSIVGVAAFRIFLTTTRAGGDVLTTGAVQSVLTPVVPAGATTAPMTGGAQAVLASNMALIGARGTLPDDDIHLSIKVDRLTEVQTVRVYFDVDATTNNFLQNYYFFEWRANDLIAAIQALNAAAVSSIVNAQQTVVGNAIVSSPIQSPAAGVAVPRPRPGGTTAPIALPPSTSANPVRATPAQLQAILSGGSADAANATSNQLAVGNNQWIELRCKVSQLEHAGTDPSRTLANVAAVEVLVSAISATALTVQYDSLTLTGGFGPDVGDIGTPYVYCYRPRSTTTGAVGNPSPPSRGGVVPRRQRVNLTGTHSADPQIDTIDWFRLGGSLTQWTYTGSGPNATPPIFADDNQDNAIVGGDPLAFDNFQPWPTTDLPRAGTCNVAGTAVQWVSGAQFNTSWAPGSVILVNGRVCTLYASPQSTLQLYVNENAGLGVGVPFYLPSPTLLSQPLRALWGHYDNQVHFAAGDPNNPNILYWTNPQTIEAASDANVLAVTEGDSSEPIQSGCFWDGTNYVASTENLYEVVRDPSGVSAYRAQVTPCKRGFLTAWCWCTGPEGIFFRCKDGIGLTAGGTPARIITSPDLRPLFPHDGVPGVSVNGIDPPDDTQLPSQRLTYVDGYVYYDYLSTSEGQYRTLVYEVALDRWWYDKYASGIRSRLSEQGLQIHDQLVGAQNGNLYQTGGATDDGVAIAGNLTLVLNQGDARREKLYRDVMIDADLGGVPLLVTLGVNNNGLVLPAVTLTPIAGRAEYLIDEAALGQFGTYGTNITLTLTWSTSVAHAPRLYLYDISAQPTPELAANWLSGPTTHGLPGYQDVAAVLLAYRSSTTITFTLWIDGVPVSYVLPSTNSQYAKVFQWLKATKGLAFQYSVSSAPGGSGFQLFDGDSEAWVQPWGMAGGYQKLNPFRGAGVISGTPL